MKRASILVVIALCSLELSAGDLRRIQRKYENQDWEKTEELILKSIEDQPINPGAKYYYSKLFLEATFNRTSLDSARIYIFAALEDFTKSLEDVLEEMTKEEVFQSDLQTLFDTIEALCYERATELNTIQDWNLFLIQFPEFDQIQDAIDARDALVYADLKSNLTIGSTKEFLETYPSSIFTERAKNKLDSMLVLKHRQSDSVDDLEKFIREHPNSEYRNEALEHLLPLKTLSGKITDFISFIRAYPRTKTGRKAIGLAFHLDAESGFSSQSLYLDYHPNSDSLREEIQNRDAFFFPVFEKTFQLVAPSGRSVETNLTELDQSLICDGINSDILTGSDQNGPKIINLNGRTIFEATLIKDLGAGFLLIKEGRKISLAHKSGIKVVEGIDDASLLNNSFLKVKKGKWGLYSLLGLKLSDHRFDEIFLEGNFWFFEKNGLYAITQQRALSNSYPEGPFLEFKFDDYELITDDKLIGFRDDRECMIKSDGEFIVPWGIHQIFPSETREYVKNENGYAFFDNPERFEYVEANAGFTMRKISDDQWSLFGNKENWMLPLRDSIKLINNHCTLLTGEKRNLIFTNQNQIELEEDQQVLTLSPQQPYILLKSKVSTILDQHGTRVFSGNFDQIKLLTDSLFSVSFRNKYGVISISGDQILPTEYDYIGIHKHLITTLKKNRIGAYDLRSNILINPEYESKIEAFGPYYQTSSSGKFGLIDSDEDVILPFEFDELRYWTDSLVWGKQEDHFKLINLNSLEPEMKVTLLTSFPSTTGETVKFYDTRGFGLRNNELGLILEPTFSEIRILGTPGKGVLIGEQALPQAGYRILSYFDFRGNRIYSQAYRSEDYERLFCDE